MSVEFYAFLNFVFESIFFRNIYSRTFFRLHFLVVAFKFSKKGWLYIQSQPKNTNDEKKLLFCQEFYESISVRGFLVFSKLYFYLVLDCFFEVLADNGKGLCEVRATATEISRGNRTLAKTFSIF